MNINKLERILLWLVTSIVLSQTLNAAFRVTSTGDSSGTTWLRITGIPTADRALCVNSSGSLGQCTISLATGLCVTGCSIP